MANGVTIYWTPVFGQNTEESNVMFLEPDSLYKYISENRECSQYLMCPGFIDMVKNTFIVRAPYDMEAEFDRVRQTMTFNHSKDVYDRFCVNRLNHIAETDPILVTLPPRYVMYSEDEVQIQVLPLMLHDKPTNWNIVPGTYDISKWIRSLDFSFELVGGDTKFKVKRNDPLFCIKFVTKNNEKVTLERVDYDFDTHAMSFSCVGVKERSKNLPLATLYKMAEPAINLFKKKKIVKKSKCPFHFWK